MLQLCVNKHKTKVVKSISQQFLIQKLGISDERRSRIQVVNIKSVSHGKQIKFELDFMLKTVDATCITEINKHAGREYSLR